MTDQFLWWRDGVIYQIYPRSFADANGDGIGDLAGITSRLDYLAQLGVDAIWLSPIYPSPNVDFGYDVSDYTAIDPHYGTMEDFDQLLREAHNRKIRVVLDLVLNHTSDQHPWFQAARADKKSPYHDYYLWREQPNNWQAVFGGPAWQKDSADGKYYMHMFYKEQPDVNWRNPTVRAEMLNVFRFWLERGVDGFRLDVFNVYFKDAAFRNNPPAVGIRPFDWQQHIHDCDQPELTDLLREIRDLLDSYPERYAVGETFLSTPAKAARYSGPDQLHGTFEFSTLFSSWIPSSFWHNIQRWYDALRSDAWPTVVMNNHDVRRAATRYNFWNEDDARLQIAAALLLTLRGTPFLYYGEEIGMRDIRVPRSQIQDPIGKRYWPFYPGRDGCRSPMQWDAEPNAGFSTAQPWLPPHPNYLQRNVAAQQAASGSLWHWYRRLIAVRRELPALRQGMFQWLTFHPQRLLAYLRQTEGQMALVALNYYGRPVRLALGGELQRHKWRLALSNRRETLPPVTGGWLPLAGHEAVILVSES